MVMDFRSSLCVERMQLSDDPDDWVWARWYFARPGAKPYPYFHAYGEPLWEGEDRENKVGPRFTLTPSQFRPSQVSPYDGQEFHGRPEWFADGLPKDARQTGDVGQQCGGEGWSVNVPLTLVVSSDQVVYETVADGGEVQGGEAFTGTAVTEFADGGEVQGGEAAAFSPQTATGEGGEVQGGQADVSFSTAAEGEGGEVQGGEASAFSPQTATGEGGEVQGGEAEFSFTAFAEGEGGEVEGGSADFGFAYTAVGDGGEVEGGEASAAAHYVETADGGEVQGGESTAFSPQTVYAEGGEVQGGEATAFQKTSIPGEGGEVQGGAAETTLPAPTVAEGGEVSGGEAGYVTSPAVVGEGGQVEGGEASAQGEDVITGAMLPWAGAGAPPAGYLPCDGSAVSRTTYAALYQVIGGTYGVGDGSTTFNLPNCTGRFLCHEQSPSGSGGPGSTGGNATLTLSVVHLPSHTHTVPGRVRTAAVTSNSGGFERGDNVGGADLETGGGNVSGQPAPIVNPYLVVKYVIKT